MGKLTKLTPSQTKHLAASYEEWLSVGRCTEPADRPAMETAVRAMYAEIGQPPPAVVWLDSPLAGVCGSWFLSNLLKTLRNDANQLGDQLRDQLRDQLGGQLRGQLGDQLRGQLGDQLWDQLWGQLGGQLGDQLRDQLRGQLRDQLRDQLWGQLGGQLRGQLGDQLRDQLWGQLGDQLRGQLGGQLRGQLGGQLRGQLGGQLRDQLRGQLGDQLWDQLWGQLGGQLGDQLRDQLAQCWWAQHEAAWIAFYLWPETNLAVNYKEQVSRRLALWETTARSSSWWWPMIGLVVLTERPSNVSVDGEGRLHDERGPALGYRDGWGVWSIHGVRVTPKIVEHPESLTVQEIRDEPNVEVRRVMLERFGADRFMAESNAELIGEDDWGKLWRIPDAPDEPDGKPLVLVEMLNSTPEPDGSVRTYYERAHPDVQTPLAALAWQANMSESEYMQMGAQT